MMKPNYYCFSELFDDEEKGVPNHTIPLGIFKMIKYNIPNAIIELNIGWKGLKPASERGPRSRRSTYTHPADIWSWKDHCELILQRISTVKTEVNENANIFVNFRDAAAEFMNTSGAQRLITFVIYLAKLPDFLRPQGVMFEEPMGDIFPWQIRNVCRCIRYAMDKNGWANAELLFHIHKNFGMSEGVVQEALAHGATGVWTGVSEEGAGVGAASSLMTLTNLARYGNPEARKYPFSKLMHAAREITFITSGQEPWPKVELYGRRAMDILWNPAIMSQVSDFDMAAFFDHPSPIRVSTFTTPELFRQRLVQVFGGAEEDYEEYVTKRMRKVLHDDLLEGSKYDYQSPGGLYDLYLRAGGVKHRKKMVGIIHTASNIANRPKLQFSEKSIKSIDSSSGKTSSARSDKNSMINYLELHNKQLHISDTNPLLQELRSLFNLYATPGTETMSYKNFFLAFIQRFMAGSHANAPKSVALMKVIDVEGSGNISWDEVLVWARWAIVTYNLSIETCNLEKMLHMIFIGHLLPVAFQQMYKHNQKGTGNKNIIQYIPSFYQKDVLETAENDIAEKDSAMEDEEEEIGADLQFIETYYTEGND